MQPPFPHAGELAALASSVLWASAFLGFARLGHPVPAGAINLGKNATASLCFAVLFTVSAGVPWPTGLERGATWLFVLSGLIGLTLCDTLLFRAMHALGPQRTTLLMLGAVPLTVLAALLPPWSERSPSALCWGGILACLTGVSLAVTERHPDPLAAPERRRGVALGLLAAVLQAAGVMLSRWAFLRHGGTGLSDAAQGAGLRLYAGTLGLVALALATRRAGVWSAALGRGRVLPRLALAAFFGTFLGIWANQAGLTWAEHAGVATTLNQLAPVWLIPLTTLFLGERHGLRSWGATLIAVADVVVIGLS